MLSSLKEILKHRKTYFSQNGEDGFLEYILETIPLKTKWCVEFGAWNGKHLSNTYHFISKRDFNAILIEGDSDKADDLVVNMNKYKKCYCLNNTVEISGENSLDNILKKTSIPSKFDLLSIDIDGDDYYVWESLKDYDPSVVIVEINIRNKPNVKHINKSGEPFKLGVTGTSILSMTELARSKGYALIANVSCNAVYVKDEYLNLFHQKEVSPADVFLYEGHKMYELTFDEVKSLGVRTSLFWMLKKSYQAIAFWRTKWAND